MRVCLAIMFMLAAQARAQDSDVPLAVLKGDTVPSDGVFLTTSRAGRIYIECETAKRNAADFEKALKDEPPPATVTQLAVALGIGVFLGAVVTFAVVKVTSK